MWLCVCKGLVWHQEQLHAYVLDMILKNQESKNEERGTESKVDIYEKQENVEGMYNMGVW